MLLLQRIRKSVCTDKKEIQVKEDIFKFIKKRNTRIYEERWVFTFFSSVLIEVLT